MEIFLNELSMHDQCYSPEELDAAFRELFSVLDFLHRQPSHLRTVIPELSSVTLMNHVNAVSCLNNLRDKSLKTAICKLIYDKSKTDCWESSRLHANTDRYHWLSQDVTDTSVEEAAERILQDESLQRCLLNFTNSTFSGLDDIPIIKTSNNSNTNTTVPCIECTSSTRRWILTFAEFEAEYDHQNSTIPPRDIETILRDNTRYQKTSHKCQGRIVYKEEASGCYFYVDNFHIGTRSHLEVFDSQGEHLGESPITQKVIDSSKMDATKKLNL